MARKTSSKIVKRCFRCTAVLPAKYSSVRKYCKDCQKIRVRERSAKRMARLKKANKCYGCMQPLDRVGTVCVKCLAKRNAKVFNYRVELVNMLGGKCQRCGIASDNPAIFDFHHPDPRHKEPTAIHCAKAGNKKYIAEVLRCILLCANCHREVHHPLLEDIPGSLPFSELLPKRSYKNRKKVPKEAKDGKKKKRK